MDEGRSNVKKLININEKEKKNIIIKERDLSPLPNIENNNQKEITSKMSKIISIMYDDNFVLMINELSSSIKKFYKEMNQNFLEMKQVIQGHLEDTEDNSSYSDLNLDNNINNINTNNLILIFSNIQKSFSDFYLKAKIIFKKMKNYRNEKLKNINESANELQTNKILKFCLIKNNQNNINIKENNDNIDNNNKLQTNDLIIENALLKKKLLILEKHLFSKDNYNKEGDNNIISNCINNRIFITDIKLLLNILQLEKIKISSSNISDNNKNNSKNELFHRREELIKKINQEIEEIPENNFLNNINPYMANNNIILSNNNINNNNLFNIMIILNMKKKEKSYKKL
jgi:hypothetical protein